jgi:hypothetical protein
MCGVYAAGTEGESKAALTPHFEPIRGAMVLFPEKFFQKELAFPPWLAYC